MSASINLEDMKRFYAAKKIDSNCPVCGAQHWIFADPPDPGSSWALASHRENGAVTLPFPTVPLVMLVCDNCQHLRLHAAVTVREWLRANPAS